MPRASHATLIFISGLVWIVIGFFLLRLGLNLISHAALLPTKGYYPFLSFSAPLFGGFERGAVALIATGLLAGFLKGKSVLRKAAERGIARILSLPNPASLGQMYDTRYYILIGLMVGLGFAIKFFAVPNDIRGVIDTAIGAALINGSVVYLRHAIQLYRSQAKGN